MRDGRANPKKQIVSYLSVAERSASSDFEYTLDCGHVAKRRIGHTIHGAWMHPSYVRCTEC